jgi:hypothetical protein
MNWPNSTHQMVQTLTGEPLHQEDAWAYFDSSMEDRPEVCPEVWNPTPVDPDLAMREVRLMCGGK